MDGNFEESPAVTVSGEQAAEDDELVLTSLHSVENVNALATDQRIDFDPALTVLFGQNASGKTGYSRILKRAANVRTAEEILANARLNSEQTKRTPSAKIGYRLGQDENEVAWNNEQGLEPLNRISVFDTRSVDVHINNELGYVFTPSELNLLRTVNSSIKLVQQRLTAEIDAIKPKGSAFLSSFQTGSVVYPHIETLGAATDVNILREMAGLSDAEASEFEGLAQDVAALKAGTQASITSNLKRRSRAMHELASLLQRCESFKPTDYMEALGALDGARSAMKTARELLTSDRELPEPLDDEWQTFVTAAHNYQRHMGHDEYPASGEPCPYCRQPLGQEAEARLRRFRDLLDGRLQTDVHERERALEAIAQPFAREEIEKTVEAQRSALSEEGSDPPAWMPRVDETTASLVEAQIAVRERRALPDSQQSSDVSLPKEILAAAAALELRIVSSEAEQQDGAEALQTKSRAIRDLSDRKRLGELWSEIEARIEAFKRASRLTTLNEGISKGVLRSSTELSKTVSTETVNSQFAELFEEERQALRAPDVDLEFIGRAGQAERRKVVASHRPSEILSEGEQKVLAIADFLAECRMRGIKAPMVFDDPVSSLDYRRLQEVAERITQLARHHQVIVFTHNIMFATALLDLRSGKKERCAFYEVQDEGDTKGLVGADVEPKLDSPTTIAKDVEATLKRAEDSTSEPVVRDALVKQGAALIRKWLETFVEQELLGSVTQRFRTNVRLGSLENIKVDRLDAAFEVVGKAFELTSQTIEGHSHADEQLNVKVTRTELQDLWTELKSVRSEYLAK